MAVRLITCPGMIASMSLSGNWVGHPFLVAYFYMKKSSLPNISCQLQVLLPASFSVLQKKILGLHPCLEINLILFSFLWWLLLLICKLIFKLLNAIFWNGVLRGGGWHTPNLVRNVLALFEPIPSGLLQQSSHQISQVHPLGVVPFLAALFPVIRLKSLIVWQELQIWY